MTAAGRSPVELWFRSTSSTAAAVIVEVIGSTSIRTGRAPVASMAATVATAVWEGATTACPGPISQARSASSIASVPLRDADAVPHAEISSRIRSRTAATSSPRM